MLRVVRNTCLFQIRKHVYFVGLRGKDIVASMAHVSLCIERLFLLKGKGKELGGGFEDGFLKGGGDAVVFDYEKSGAQAGGADLLDDGIAFRRGRIGEEGSDIHGRDIECRCTFNSHPEGGQVSRFN